MGRYKEGGGGGGRLHLLNVKQNERNVKSWCSTVQQQNRYS